MTAYSEPDLVVPTLFLLDQHPEGLTTSDLIRKLEQLLKPNGHDTEILAGRNDTRFSQKVRNLVSHRTLVRRGFEVYKAAHQHHTITPAGREYLAERREQGEVAARIALGPSLPATAIFPRYQMANEAPATRVPQPFSIDPNAVDRALGAHAAVQNALAQWVESKGMTPLRSGHSDVDFDLAWEDGAQFNVAEIKSLTNRNENSQLRLGLGQVLHYAALLRASGQPVRPILATPRAPSDPLWVRLCDEHGVWLVWPGEFDRLDD